MTSGFGGNAVPSIIILVRLTLLPTKATVFPCGIVTDKPFKICRCLLMLLLVVMGSTAIKLKKEQEQLWSSEVSYIVCFVCAFCILFSLLFFRALTIQSPGVGQVDIIQNNIR
jgi:hypothetical protein